MKLLLASALLALALVVGWLAFVCAVAGAETSVVVANPAAYRGWAWILIAIAINLAAASLAFGIVACRNQASGKP